MDDHRMILDGVSDSEQPCYHVFFVCFYLLFNPCVAACCSLPRNLSQRQHLGWPPELSHFHSQVPRRNSNRMRHNCCRNWCITRFEKKTLSFLFLFVLEVPTQDWTGSGIFFNGSISFGVIDRPGWYSVGSHIPGIVGNPKPGEHLTHCMYIHKPREPEAEHFVYQIIRRSWKH